MEFSRLLNRFYIKSPDLFMYVLNYIKPTNKGGRFRIRLYTRGYNFHPVSPSSNLVPPSKDYFPNHGRGTITHPRTREASSRPTSFYRLWMGRERTRGKTVHYETRRREDDTDFRRTPGTVYGWSTPTVRVCEGLGPRFNWRKEIFDGSVSMRKYRYGLSDCLYPFML